MSRAEAVAQAINATTVAEVVKIQESDTQIRITHRVFKNRLKVWLGIVEYVLTRKHGWDAHVSKQYFLKNGRLLYAWNFIAQWQDPSSADDLANQIRTLLVKAGNEVPLATHQLESYPLVAKDTRNEPKGPMNIRASGPMTGGVSQKGAHRIGGK